MITASDIADITAEILDVPVEKMRGATLCYKPTLARHIAIFVCCESLNLPKTDIASYFNREHSQCNYAQRRIEREVPRNDTVRWALQEVRAATRAAITQERSTAELKGQMEVVEALAAQLAQAHSKYLAIRPTTTMGIESRATRHRSQTRAIQGLLKRSSEGGYLMEYPPLPDIKDDDRPRWLRAAHQNFLHGFSLYVDPEGGFAMWRHISKPPMACGWVAANKIIRDAGEIFGASIIVGGMSGLADYDPEKAIREASENEDERDESSEDETVSENDMKRVVLTKTFYTAAELSQLTGYSTGWAYSVRDQLTAKRSGPDRNDLWHYFTDEKLVKVLEDRGYEVELTGEAIGAAGEDRPDRNGQEDTSAGEPEP